MDGHLIGLRHASVVLLAACAGMLPVSVRAQLVAPRSNELAQVAFRSLSMAARDGPAGSMALVEIPADAGPLAATPIRRPRHALRLRSQMAESAMRSLGIDASECAMLFRMNSRAAAAGTGGSFVLKPQMHLACRF